MKREEDCYFYLNDELGKIRCICKECNEKETYQQKDTWFWPGSEKGYGPFNFICESCEQVIHAKEEITPPSKNPRR